MRLQSYTGVYMLFTEDWRSVWVNSVPLVLSLAYGQRWRVTLKITGTVFPIWMDLDWEITVFFSSWLAFFGTSL